MTKQPAAICVNAVSHVFPNGLRAIEDVSFEIQNGEFVAIVGPSGCGKTTILNIIAGLTPLQQGKVTLANHPPKPGRPETAYMFAQDALLPWRTVLENAIFGVEVRQGRRSINFDVHQRAKELLDSVGLSEFAQCYPRQLSHGMRQRAALVRTFMMPSSVLLMDEPFGALDAHTKLTLEHVLLRLWDRDKRTVAFITHDLAEAITLADRILVCSARPGRIKADIPVDLERPRKISELQSDQRYHQVYQRIWSELQTEMAI